MLALLPRRRPGGLGETLIAKRERPYGHLTARGWQNLALAGLLAFYVLYTLLHIILGTMCGQLGVDYCDYWSAGRVANLHGYAEVYDLQTLGAMQKSILPASAGSLQVVVIPFPYLPVFVLPFQLLSLLSPQVGFWIWTAAGVAAFALYLRRFSRALEQPSPPPRLMLMILVSLPVYMSIFAGQVVVWLAICLGEFTLALVRGRPFRAGLWLGALLLKPQVLVLILLVLLVQRAARIIAGLAVSSSLQLAACLLLGGSDALTQMSRLWLLYANGQARIWVEGMMNWRMLGFHLSTFSNPSLGVGIAGLGMLVTLIMTLSTWRRPFELRPSPVAIAVLGVFAASATVAWHSHIHSAVILIPSLLYLYQARILPQKAFNYWVFLPSFFFVAVAFLPAAFTKLNLSLGHFGSSIYLFIGASEFGVTFYLFWWAMQASRRDIFAQRGREGLSKA
jgi:Glycosyltransferase family 87